MKEEESRDRAFRRCAAFDIDSIDPQEALAARKLKAQWEKANPAQHRTFAFACMASTVAVSGFTELAGFVRAGKAERKRAREQGRVRSLRSTLAGDRVTQQIVDSTYRADGIRGTGLGQTTRKPGYADTQCV
jgi:hypothetical protein